MKKNRIPLVLSAALLLACNAALGEQRQVYGTVIDVVPLHSEDAAAVECASVPKPDSNEGLAVLLAWDLLERPQAERDCLAAQPRIDGYRVTYEWNGHEFEDVLPRDPGAKIPLTVQID